jgi:hypothetical protein
VRRGCLRRRLPPPLCKAAHRRPDLYVCRPAFPADRFELWRGRPARHAQRAVHAGRLSVFHGLMKSPDDRIALTFQALPWLEATIRYTIDYALPPPDQRALYSREFDLKARLFQETEYTPQIAVGTSGHHRHRPVFRRICGCVQICRTVRSDGRSGMGRARAAGRRSTNPLCAVYVGILRSSLPSRARAARRRWIISAGPTVGLFGGIEYQTPIPKLTFKIEYSTYAYREESQVQHISTMNRSP